MLRTRPGRVVLHPPTNGEQDMASLPFDYEFDNSDSTSPDAPTIPEAEQAPITPTPCPTCAGSGERCGLECYGCGGTGIDMPF